MTLQGRNIKHPITPYALAMDSPFGDVATQQAHTTMQNTSGLSVDATQTAGGRSHRASTNRQALALTTELTTRTSNSMSGPT